MAGFLSKLTGGGDNEQDYNQENDFESNMEYNDSIVDDFSDEISLAIDAYEDENNLYIKTFIPAVDPKEIDIDITRDTVIISGERYSVDNKGSENYFQKELSWGKFSKKILLPKEVDIESINATINFGTLTLKLPKIDKDRRVKVNIR